MRVLERLDQFAEALSSECEKKKVWILSAFSIVYFFITGLLASRKLMWNDELYTVYVSRLSSPADMWSALSTGADQIPPFFHTINRASFALFGFNHLSIRLPEVIGFWVMSVCVFHFVSKRSSTLYGLAALLFPLITFAYDYAYEARPYGLVLGFAGLSLVCWQSAAEGRYRRLSLIGIGASLAAAVSSHYYAVLLFFPLAVGEIARSLYRRYLDVPIWIAFGAALTPLILFFPLISKAKLYSVNFWSQPAWELIPGFFYFLLLPASVPVLVWFVFSALFVPHADVPSCGAERLRGVMPVHEIAVAVGFVAIPVVGVVLAKLLIGVFNLRYALPAVIGLSVLLAFAAYRLLHGRAIVALTGIVTFASWIVVMQVMYFRQDLAVSVLQSETYEFLRSGNHNDLPIVVSDPHTFMKLAHYAPPDLASRLVYLAAPEASLRHLGHNTVDRGMLDLKDWFRIRVEDYGCYILSHQRFLVHARFVDTHGKLWSRGQLSGLTWLLSELTQANRRIELLRRNTDDLLFLVERDQPADEMRTDQYRGSGRDSGSATSTTCHNAHDISPEAKPILPTTNVARD